MSADVSDLLKLAGEFDRAADRAPAESKQLVVKVAATAQSVAKAKAPVLKDRKKAPNERPGELRDSIDTRLYGVSGIAGFRAVVRANDRSGWFVEAGTARSRPQPFMEPAREVAQRELEADAQRLPDKLL